MNTYIVVSFTDVPFRGNPAGVCIAESPLHEEMMLHVAQELGLSETAFIQATDEPGAFAIRYFSPKMEIPRCGHTSLASAKVVFALHDYAEVRFMTFEGLELVVRQEDGDGRIAMDFPVYEVRPAEALPALLDALGISAAENVAYNDETHILLLEIAEARELAVLKPNFAALYQSHDAINGVLVTAPGTDGYDFHSRYFWPWSGTDEDPVTGGTHTFLAPYWAARLGKSRMQSFQSSSRTGSMEVEVAGEVLTIRGHTVIVFDGHLAVSLT